jgi:MoaA/NifB/PqqE/SkfB family radical SAM enzyme
MRSLIGFHITDRCQLNCDHCLRDPGMKALDIDVELIRRVLPQTRVYNVEHVALTGGEPTLHPDFVGIIDAIVDNGMTWHMVSNGLTFDRVLEKLDARPERLQALGMVDFSLDGATEATHDSIRGDGSYRAVMAAVSMCVVRSIPFLLQMTVNARNSVPRGSASTSRSPPRPSSTGTSTSPRKKPSRSSIESG